MFSLPQVPRAGVAWCFHTYLVASNLTTNEDIKGSWSGKRGAEDSVNPYSYNNIVTNCCMVLCGPMPPSLIDRRGFVLTDSAPVPCSLIDPPPSRPPRPHRRWSSLPSWPKTTQACARAGRTCCRRCLTFRASRRRPPPPARTSSAPPPAPPPPPCGPMGRLRRAAPVAKPAAPPTGPAPIAQRSTPPTLPTTPRRPRPPPPTWPASPCTERAHSDQGAGCRRIHTGALWPSALLDL
ncbi:hypothetical protein AAFF_G00384710 [Aldrovandia affinis]|uniref:Uncharacterized protein n=1 Tax=Aldrovandia affinis TaxID=143900 RepID=A0AAD7R451_9TELE|nr:hypothetical protein AAFF_G00384710 [Aldrovandia affinis]